MAYSFAAGAALGIDGESAIDAFNRQAAMGASSMGYDVPSPNMAPGGYAYHPGPLSVGVPDTVDMNDSTKRGRVSDVPSSVASSVRPAKRPAEPASSGTGAPSSLAAPPPLPLPDAARLQALTH